jgi:hypothetical protein
LLGLTQEQTAERWPVVKTTGEKPTRQAVAKALNGAHWMAVKGVLETVEKRQMQPPVVAVIDSNLQRLRSAKANPGAFSEGAGGSKS